jgi:triosephosphate isomerase
MRRPIIIGAQKLFLSLSDSIQFSRSLAASLDGKSLSFDVLICPSLVNLAHVASTLIESQVYVGAQNFHQEDTGPFTGQVSLRELINLNILYVLVGHSELRQQGETDDVIRNKIELCLKHHITPIICLGEDGDERKAGKAYRNIEQRIRNLFPETVVRKYPTDNIIIAYEPTWMPPLGDEAGFRLGIHVVNDTCDSIREILNNLFGPQAGENIRVLFGGGVNEGSAKALLLELRVDGFLIGRASANIASFLHILEAAEESIGPRPQVARIRAPGVAMAETLAQNSAQVTKANE